VNFIEDFGGNGPILHFAHANAYPVKTYTSFLKLFTDHYTVIGLNQRPMWEDSSPGTFEDWTILAKDLIKFLRQNQFENVVGVGHSMGANATLMAAQIEPTLFSKIILIDPVVLPEPIYEMIAKTSFEQMRTMNPIIETALMRQNEWLNQEDAIQYFESKKFYQRFSNQAKLDFIEHGLTKQSNGSFTLAYPREWEARIYGTNNSPWQYLRLNQHPCLIVRAEQSDVIRTDEAWGLIKNQSSAATCIQMDDVGHLIPQEHPLELHKMIMEFL